MASVIQVANRALTKLGATRIISLDDNNKQARSISNCFEDLRDAELRAHRWQFSIVRTSLAASTTTPAFGFDYQYPLPSDFLRLDMINDQYPDTIMDDYIGSETAEYAIEGNNILTSISAPLKLRYIAQIVDPNQWDALFREALACRIAAEICEDLTQSDTKKQNAWNEWKRAIVEAGRVGAIERPPQMPPDDNLIISRL
jgi:hypothetical protein